MKRIHGIFWFAVMTATLLSGCDRVHISIFPEGNDSKKEAEAAQVTMTPEETALSPTPVPAEITVTPVPTSTPAPRRIGTKTSTSKYIYLTNNLSNPIRELYLRVSGGDDWGKNLIPSESSVKSEERVQMFYAASDTASQYEMRVVDKAGNSYALYYITLSDMESAVLSLDSSNTAYLNYTSLSTSQTAQNDYSEILAYGSIDYSQSANSNDSDSDYSYETDGDWEVYYYDDSSDDSSSYDSDSSVSGGTYTSDGTFYIPDYDPDKDYSAFEGDSNYGYYNDYGNWISYY